MLGKPRVTDKAILGLPGSANPPDQPKDYEARTHDGSQRYDGCLYEFLGLVGDHLSKY
jgi:hypothetical protein